jgi:hypothetical protein
MVINFRVSEINQGACKPIQIPILIKKIYDNRVFKKKYIKIITNIKKILILNKK